MANPSITGSWKIIGAKAQKLVPLKGPDNNVVIGPDGQPVMVPANMAQQTKGGRVPLPMLQGMMNGDKGKGKGQHVSCLFRMDQS